MNHFDEMTGLAYLEGELSQDRARDLVAHLNDCEKCRTLLHVLDREGVWLRESLQSTEDAIPASLIATPQENSVPWGWIIGLGFGFSGAYTLWSNIVSPWLDQASDAGFAQGDVFSTIFFSSVFWDGWGTVLNVMVFLAAATLGSIGLWLLRKRLVQRHTSFAIVIATAILLSLGYSPTASATQVERGDPTYTLPAGQEVKSDLVVSAGRTRIDGDVDGDLIVMSHDVTVNGHVKGDVIAIAWELHINGTVDGNLRALAQGILLTGQVGRNVMAWSQSTETDEKSKVGGSVTLGGGDLDVNGQVGGDILTFGGQADINGIMNGDVDIHNARLRIGPQADIHGKATFEGARPPRIASSAKLASPIQTTIVRRGIDYTSPRYYWHEMLFWGARLLFGLGLILLAPLFFYDAEHSAKKLGRSFGMGALVLFAVPVAALVAGATIVGLGISVPLMLMYFLAVYAAEIFVGAWLGEKLLGAKVGLAPAVARLAVGLAIIHALRMIPFAGIWITVLVTIWGMGALSLALYKNLRPQVAAAAAA